MVSLELIETQQKHTQQVAVMFVYVLMYIHIYAAIIIKEKEAVNLKSRGSRAFKGLAEEKEGGMDVILF